MVLRFVYGCNHNSLQETCELYRVVCLGHSRVRPVFTRVPVYTAVFAAHIHGPFTARVNCCIHGPCTRPYKLTRPCLWLMYTGRLRPVYTAVFTACVYARLHGPWPCAGRVYGRVHDRLCLWPSIQALSTAV